MSDFQIVCWIATVLIAFLLGRWDGIRTFDRKMVEAGLLPPIKGRTHTVPLNSEIRADERAKVREAVELIDGEFYIGTPDSISRREVLRKIDELSD